MAQMKAHHIDLSKESGHQEAVILWSEQESIRKEFPELSLLHHIPNGGRRDAIDAARLKRQGVKSGVPDLHLPVARGKWISLYVEMKRPGGKTTPEQDWWIDHLSKAGNKCAVCVGWEEAVECITDYLSTTSKN